MLIILWYWSYCHAWHELCSLMQNMNFHHLTRFKCIDCFINFQALVSKVPNFPTFFNSLTLSWVRRPVMINKWLNCKYIHTAIRFRWILSANAAILQLWHQFKVRLNWFVIRFLLSSHSITSYYYWPYNSPWCWLRWMLNEVQEAMLRVWWVEGCLHVVQTRKSSSNVFGKTLKHLQRERWLWRCKNL